MVKRSFNATPRIADGIIEVCLLFLVIFTPIALGTVQPWSIFIMRIVVVIALSAWIFKVFFQPVQQIYRPPNQNRTHIFKNKLFRFTPLALPIFIYLFIATISTIFSSYKQLSLDLLANLFVYVSVYFLVINNLRSERQTKRLIIIILVVSCTLGIYGLLQYFNILNFTPRATELRISSTYYNSNHYAGYLAMITPIVVALSLFLPLNKFTIPLIFLSILLTANLALSYSYGAVGFGVGIIFLVVMKISLSSRKKLSMAIAVIILISFASLGAGLMLSKTPKIPEDTFSERYEHMVEFGISHTKSRLYVFKNTIPVILDHPYFGAGLGTFIYTFPKHRPPDIRHFRNYAHNDYLEIATGMGLIGLIAYLFLIVKIFTNGFKGLKSIFNFNKAVIIGTLAGMLSILIHGFFDGNLTIIPANILYFYVLVGLIMNLMPNAKY